MATVTDITTRVAARRENSGDIPKGYKPPTGKMWMHARHTAHKVIQDMYDAYTKKGGIKEQEEALASAKATLSDSMKAIADEAVRIAKNDMRIALPHFLTLCKEAEEGLRQKHKDGGTVPPITELVPSWAPMKGQLSGAMKAGINPAKIATMGAVRSALQKHRQDTGTSGTSNRTGTGRNAGSRAAQGGFGEVLNRALSVLTMACKGLNEEKQEKAAGMIQKVAEQVAKLNPAPKEAPKAAKRAKAKAKTGGSSEETVNAPLAAQNG